jgi:hypothetical protein
MFASTCTLLLSLLLSPPVGLEAVADEVRQTDGTLLRGVIVERVPDGHVVILLPTGETRRLEASDVEYAGPRRLPGPPAPAQAAPPPPPAPPSSEVPVRWAPDNPGLVLLRQAGSGSGVASGPRGGFFVMESRYYQTLCNGPCEVQVPRGRHELAVSYAGRRPIGVGALEVEAPMELGATYEDNSSVRLWGLGAGVGGLVLGTTLVLLDDGADDPEGDPGALFYSGVGVVLVGAITAAVLMAVPDEVELSVEGE